MCVLSCGQSVQSPALATYPAHLRHVWHGTFRLSGIVDTNTGRQLVVRPISLLHGISNEGADAPSIWDACVMKLMIISERKISHYS